jgi:hypothetical protein
MTVLSLENNFSKSFLLSGRKYITTHQDLGLSPLAGILIVPLSASGVKEEGFGMSFFSHAVIKKKIETIRVRRGVVLTIVSW